MPSTGFAWLNRRIAAIVKLVARKLQAVNAVPYCYVYSLPSGFLPPTDFKSGAYPGLLAWHLVNEPSAPKLISYWQDKSSYDYTHSRFEGAVGIAQHVEGWGGAAGDLHAKEPGWWPVSVNEVLLAVAALIGAVTVVWNTAAGIVETWLASPKTEISFAVPRVDVSQGDQIKVQVNARNATAFVPVRLVATAQLTANDARQPVSLTPSEFQSVAPDAPVTMMAAAQAPALKAAHSGASVYKLAVSADARTWRFGHTKTDTGDLPVLVWPKSYGWTRQLRRVAQSDPSMYSALGTLYSGSSPPAKVSGTLSIIAPESTALGINVQPPFMRKPDSDQPTPSPPAGGRRTILMVFDSPSLEKYHAYTFQLTITSSGSGPREGWDLIEKSITITFQ